MSKVEKEPEPRAREVVQGWPWVSLFQLPNREKKLKRDPASDTAAQLQTSNGSCHL